MTTAPRPQAYSDLELLARARSAAKAAERMHRGAVVGRTSQARLAAEQWLGAAVQRGLEEAHEALIDLRSTLGDVRGAIEACDEAVASGMPRFAVRAAELIRSHEPGSSDEVEQRLQSAAAAGSHEASLALVEHHLERATSAPDPSIRRRAAEDVLRARIDGWSDAGASPGHQELSDTLGFFDRTRSTPLGNDLADRVLDHVAKAWAAGDGRTEDPEGWRARTTEWMRSAAAYGNERALVTRLSEIAPRDTAVLGDLADAFDGIGKTEQAEHCSRLAFDADPSTADRWVARLRANSRSDDPSRWVEDGKAYAKAIEVGLAAADVGHVATLASVEELWASTPDMAAPDAQDVRRRLEAAAAADVVLPVDMEADRRGSIASLTTRLDRAAEMGVTPNAIRAAILAGGPVGGMRECRAMLDKATAIVDEHAPYRMAELVAALADAQCANDRSNYALNLAQASLHGAVAGLLPLVASGDRRAADVLGKIVHGEAAQTTRSAFLPEVKDALRVEYQEEPDTMRTKVRRGIAALRGRETGEAPNVIALESEHNGAGVYYVRSRPLTKIVTALPDWCTGAIEALERGAQANPDLVGHLGTLRAVAADVLDERTGTDHPKRLSRDAFNRRFFITGGQPGTAEESLAAVLRGFAEGAIVEHRAAATDALWHAFVADPRDVARSEALVRDLAAHGTAEDVASVLTQALPDLGPGDRKRLVSIVLDQSTGAPPDALLAVVDGSRTAVDDLGPAQREQLLDRWADALGASGRSLEAPDPQRLVVPVLDEPVAAPPSVRRVHDLDENVARVSRTTVPDELDELGVLDGPGVLGDPDLSATPGRPVDEISNARVEGIEDFGGL